MTRGFNAERERAATRHCVQRRAGKAHIDQGSHDRPSAVELRKHVSRGETTGAVRCALLRWMRLAAVVASLTRRGPETRRSCVEGRR